MADKFTIRGFTANMRTRDVYACWPFNAGDATPDEVRSWLPPMTVPNWRADEVGQSSSKLAHEQLNPPSDEENELSIVEKTVSRLGDGEPENQQEEERLEKEKSEMVCPVCLDATLTAVNAHVDGCLREELRREMMSKSKEQQVKEHERSGIKSNAIMKLWPFGEDISTTANKLRWLSLQLEALASTNGGGSSTIGGGQSEKLDGGMSNSVSQEAVVRKGLSSKPQKKRSIAEILHAAPKIDGGNCNMVAREEEEEKEEEGVGIERKKKKKKSKVGTERSGIAILNNKIKIMKRKNNKMKMMMKKKNPLHDDDELPATKEDTKNGSEKEQGENCDSVEKQQEEEALSPIFGIIEISHKHIAESTSSVCNTEETKTDDAHQVAKSESHVELYGKEQPSQSNEANGNDGNRKEVFPTVESEVELFPNALPSQVAAQNLMEPCTNQEKGESSSSKVAASSDKFDNSSNSSSHAADASTSSLSPLLQAQQRVSGGSINNTPAGESGASISNANASTRRTVLELSSSNPSSSYNNNGSKALSGRSRPSSYMVPANMIGSLLFSSQGNKGSATDLNHQNFVGLPLNSHGELNNFSTGGGNVGMNQTHSSLASRGSFRVPAEEDRVNPVSHYSARLGITTESPGNNERSDSQLKIIARSLFSVEGDKMPNHKTSNVGMVSPNKGSSSSSDLVSPSLSPSTVRLMGKDVPIGETSSENNGDALVGEEFRRRHCSEVVAAAAATADNNSPLGRCSNHNRVSANTQNSHSPQSTTSLVKGSPGGILSRDASANLQRTHQFKPQALVFQSQALPTSPQPNSSFLDDRRNHHHHHVSSSAFGFPSPNSGSGALPSWIPGSSSTHERVPGTSVNHHSLERIEYPSSNSTTTRKRAATADLFDLTRPNKLPNTGQSSGNAESLRDDEELLDHSRLMMMNCARSRTQQQNEEALNPTLSSSGAVQTNPAGFRAYHRILSECG